MTAYSTSRTLIDDLGRYYAIWGPSEAISAATPFDAATLATTIAAAALTTATVATTRLPFPSPPSTPPSPFSAAALRHPRLRRPHHRPHHHRPHRVPSIRT
jgi:hypothetical protein